VEKKQTKKKKKNTRGARQGGRCLNVGINGQKNTYPFWWFEDPVMEGAHGYGGPGTVGIRQKLFTGRFRVEDCRENAARTRLLSNKVKWQIG